MKKNLPYLTKQGVVLSLLTLTVLLSMLLCVSPSYGNSIMGQDLSQQINDKMVTVKMTNASIKEILYSMQQQSGISFAYDDKELATLSNRKISLENVSVKQVLDEILKDTPFTYRMIDKGISIYRKEAPKTQKIEITGKVLDKKGKPVVGATVIIIGTTIGAVSDDRGEFKLKAQVGDRIEASYVGFQTTNLKIEAGQNTVQIRMEQDVLAVDNVIVTGIFNKSKESYTGSVTTISSKDIKMYKGSNLLNTLKNIDPSLNVMSNNSFGSDPNRLPEVNIRGNSSLPTNLKELDEGAQAQLNTPLVLMDGFEISLQRLMDFNDDEIESINILKDASATAIYGSRGANGVIVVITKVPQAGKMRINVQGGVNIQIPDLSSYSLLNAEGKLELERTLGIYRSDETLANLSYQDQYNKILRDIRGGVDTYWLSKPLKTGVGERYNVRLDGGSQDFRWGVSLSNNKVGGVMKGSMRNVLDGTINLAYSIKNVQFKNQTSITLGRGQESPYGPFSEYTKMNPYWRTHDDNGNLIKSYTSAVPGLPRTGNPLYNAELNSKDFNKTTDIINNFSIEWSILEELTLRVKFGITKSFNTRDYFLPAEHTEFEKDQYSYFQKGSYQYDTGEAMSYDGAATLSYSKTFAGKHQFYAGLDYSVAQNDLYSYTFDLEGYTNDNGYLPDAIAYKTGKKPVGFNTRTRRVGFTGNLNYTYDNRYFVDLSYRIDGGSQFGKQNKFAPFWSGGVGWNLHNEKWMQKNNVINELRLKGSYGQTGSLQFGAYQSLATYKDYTDDRYMYWNSAYLTGFGNKNLKWQVTDQMNVGTEIGLLSGRIRGSFDYYTKTTSNLLSARELPSANGFSSVVENVGKVKNNGFEASLTGYLVRNTSQNIFWSVTGKIAYNNNKIAQLSEAIKRQNEERIKENREVNNLLIEGNPQNSIYAVPSLGIDPSTGQELFLNKNGEKTYAWNSDAIIYCGVLDPKYRGNLSTMFTYKNLTLNLSFGYHWGGQQYNNTLLDKVEITRDMSRLNVDSRVFTERWQKPGDVVFFKSFFDADGRATTKTKSSSRFVFDDNMFSLQSASLQYIWKNKWLKETLSLQSVHFSCNMSDLFYLSSIKRERGTSYPFARTLTFAAILQF